MWLGGRGPPYTLYEHVRANMLATLATDLFGEGMKDGRFNALELIRERGFGDVEQAGELGEVDTARDVPIALTRGDFKHLSLARCQQSSARASGREESVGNLIASEPVDQSPHGFSRTLNRPFNPAVSNFERCSRHDTKVDERPEESASTR